MQISCAEYSKTMDLLGLKVRLKEGISNPEERESVEERIRELEKELNME